MALKIQTEMKNVKIPERDDIASAAVDRDSGQVVSHPLVQWDANPQLVSFE